MNQNGHPEITFASVQGTPITGGRKNKPNRKRKKTRMKRKTIRKRVKRRTR